MYYYNQKINHPNCPRAYDESVNREQGCSETVDDSNPNFAPHYEGSKHKYSRRETQNFDSAHMPLYIFILILQNVNCYGTIHP